MPSRRRRKSSRLPLKLLIALGAIALIVAIVALIDFSPSLEHMRVTMLSGPEEGNYHPMVARIARAAAEREGRVENRATQGSVDNLAQLAASGCQAEFALVQDGIPPPEKSGDLVLIGQLRKFESMFFVGSGASRLTHFSQLRGMTIGLGPAKSGTDHLARRLLQSDDFRSLGLRLVNHEFDVQVQLLERGALPLGVFVLDEDAALIRDAMRTRGLELAAFQHLDVIARQHAFLSHGRIGAGQYDPIRLLPADDTRVFRVGTLVLANECAEHTDIIGMLSLLEHVFPGFVEYNRTLGRHPHFSLSSSAERYFENGGPEFADEHAPWLVDILPTANWVYIIMCVSIFFNLTTLWHRFRLWRIDANTDKATQLVHAVLGERLTPAEILSLTPSAAHVTPEGIRDLEQAMADLDRMRARCRRQANSMMVPMGQEWIYRYSEQQMEEFLTALRKFQERVAVAVRDAG